MIRPAVRLFAGLLVFPLAELPAQSLTLEPSERLPEPQVDPATDEATRAISRFTLPTGLTAHLWAAEPMLANPVAIDFDERGRLFVSETHRYRSSVLDIRSYMGMLEQDLAARTIADRTALIDQVFGPEQARQLAIESELVRLVQDVDGNGVADASQVFATGFNAALDGIASGVLARRGQVWFTSIPSLWLLEAAPGGTTAAKRTELLRGFGVRFGYTGHDLHGLIFGPDGKLYFTIGDRGTNVTGPDGRHVAQPDTGSVFRCQPDGTEFELVATGLRNPQELAFDEHGNLFTGDNDCDNGDLERLVHVVEGGDSGWRVGYQHAPLGKAGPWMRDSLWKPRFPGQPAYLIPPICNIEDGPSGVAYYPGTGLGEAWRGHFFICHFKGSIARSGVQSYTIQPSGAGFTIGRSAVFMGGLLATDVTFGPDGRCYVADWVEGWPKSRKGRIYAIAPATADPAELAVSVEVQRWLAADLGAADPADLLRLLGHRDQRLRLEAQFALVARGAGTIPALEVIAIDPAAAPLARLHALWGLGQLARHTPAAGDRLLPLFIQDANPEVRAQAAKLLGDLRRAEARDALIAGLADPAPRVQFFAAQSLGKLSPAGAAEPLLALLRRNADQDPLLRHAAVHALAQLGAEAAPVLAAAASDPSSAVRLGVLLVYRKLQHAGLAAFLSDSDPYLVREAALAINDEPVVAAQPALAALLPGVDLQDDPLVLRAINANFRHGGAAEAGALAAFAARSDATAPHRAEALLQLGLWGQVPARDRLVGVFRPLPARDAGPARAALLPVLPALLTDAPAVVQLATLETVRQLELKSAAPALLALVANAAAAGGVRAQALAVLEALAVPELEAALATAGEARAPELRLQALEILARRSPEQALPVVERLVRDGTEAEQQAAFRALSDLNLPQAAPLLLAALDRLAAGQVAPGAQFELFDAVEKSADAAVLARWQTTKDGWTAAGDVLAPFRGALQGGDRWRGGRVFSDHPVLACIRCHKVNGDGGEAGPDLSRIGSLQTPEHVLESIIKPNARISAGFDVMSIELRDGTWEAGSVERESPTELVLKRADGSRVTLDARQVKARETVPSSMPEIYGQVLSRRELRDLMAYLRGLREPEPGMGESSRATDNGESPAPPAGTHD